MWFSSSGGCLKWHIKNKTVTPFLKAQTHFMAHDLLFMTSIASEISLLLTIFFSQSSHKFFGSNNTCFLFLWRNIVEKIWKTSQQVFFSLTQWFVGQNFLAEWSTEIQSLQHWVTITCVSKLNYKKENVFNNLNFVCSLSEFIIIIRRGKLN